VLHAGVRGVTDLMVMPGLINLDFADVKTVMEEMGKAMMGTGEAEGDRRAIQAAEAAISNPLLEDTSMRGARGVLINITGGPDMTLFEVDEAVKRIKDEVADDANIIFGSTFDDRMEGRMRISIVATGIDVAVDARDRKPQLQVVSAVGGGGRSGGMMSSFSREAEGSRSESLRDEPRLTPVRAIEQMERSQPRGFDPAPITATRASEPVATQRAPEPVAQRAVEPMAQRIVTETQALRADPVPEARASVQPTRAAATPQTMLRTVTTAKPVDAEHFIAPAPIEPKSSSTAPMRRPDPFAEAAVTNGRRPEGRSLLERMTGLARKKDPAPAAKAEDTAAKPHAPLARTFPPSRAPLLEKAEAPAAPAPVAAKPEPAPQLKVEAPARPAPAGRDDDLLEIPAFLRRQTN
jgi:cell division protein FtsZ